MKIDTFRLSMTDALLKRLTASATGAFDLHRSHYRKDCAEALAEIERLRAALKNIVDYEGNYTDLASNAECQIRDIAANALRPYQPNAVVAKETK